MVLVLKGEIPHLVPRVSLYTNSIEQKLPLSTFVDLSQSLRSKLRLVWKLVGPVQDFLTDTKTQCHCFLCLAQNKGTKRPSRTAEVVPWKLDWVRWLVCGVLQSQRPRPDGHVERGWGTPGRWWPTGRFLRDSGPALAHHSLLSNLQMQWRWALVFSSLLFLWRILKTVFTVRTYQ